MKLVRNEMPELPEVETIKTAMCQSIGNTNIIDVIVNNNQLRERIPEDLKTKIIGAQIIGYQRIAKYITINLDNGLSLIWHMGMSGRINIVDELPCPLAKHDHVVISTGNGHIIYNDARRFGLLTYCESQEITEHHLFKKTGIEPFDEKLDAKYLHDKLQKKKVPIKVALLDQEIVVGIGNIYASETLYGAGILPTRLSNEISLQECESLIVNFRQVLDKAIKAGGSTLRDYQKPDGSLGYFQNMHCVYNKTGQKCPHCTCDINKTGGIAKIVQAGRSSFYCPTKQK